MLRHTNRFLLHHIKKNSKLTYKIAVLPHRKTYVPLYFKNQRAAKKPLRFTKPLLIKECFKLTFPGYLARPILKVEKKIDDIKPVKKWISLLSISAIIVTTTGLIFYTLQNNKQNEFIVIIGLGPTGLAFTLEACKQQKMQVIALTDRDQYTRNQIFRLDEDSIDYLKQLVGEDKILDLIEQKKIEKQQDLNGYFYVIQINALESLLYSRLLDYKDKNLDIVHVPKESGVLKKFDLSSHMLDLTSKKIIFKYLIAADGAHHTDNLVEYKHFTKHSQLHNKHAIANYKLPSLLKAQDYQAYLKLGPDRQPDITELQKKGWLLFSKPEVRLFVVENTFYIGAECTHLITATNKKEIDEWLKLILRFHLPEKAISQLILINPETECSSFEIILNESNHVVECLESSTFRNPYCYFIAGDALRKSHYQTASGAVMGFKEAKAFGEFLTSQQLDQDVKEYQRKVFTFLADNTQRIDTYLEKRIKREEESKKLIS